MRFWVAGATGYTGSAFVREARAAGHDVIAHVRPGSASEERARGAFEPLGAVVDTTAWMVDPLRDRLRAERVDAVLCLIGTTRKRGLAEGMKGTEMYDKVDYGLTAMLVSAAAASGTRPCFVYLSAMGVREDARSPYMRARWKAETAVRNSGLPFVIARPGFISGSDREERRPAERVGAVVADGLLAMAGVLGARQLRDTYRSMDATTLARALLSAATDPNARHQVLEADSLRMRAGATG